MNFLLSALPIEDFAYLFGRPDAERARYGALRVIATERPGFPCRLTLDDAEVGETLLLLPYAHLIGETPYRASGPIFVREATNASVQLDAVPTSMRHRLYSIRAYDANGTMLDADIGEGQDLEVFFERFFAAPKVAFLHLHHARRGCYACRVARS